MRSTKFITVTALLLSGASTISIAANSEDLKPFPKAEDGFERRVIHLKPQPNEGDLKVEILAGKTLVVDCNSHMMPGHLEVKNLKGWGYSYYRLNGVGLTISTQKGCINYTNKEKFVPVVGDGFLVRYNSKLPIVIFAPKDIEIRYRTWSASDEVEQALQQ